jgi:hypothetical protein
LKKKITTIIYQRPIGQGKKKKLDQRLKDGGSFEEKVTSNQRLGGLIHLKEKNYNRVTS